MIITPELTNRLFQYPVNIIWDQLNVYHCFVHFVYINIFIYTSDSRVIVLNAIQDIEIVFIHKYE